MFTAIALVPALHVGQYLGQRFGQRNDQDFYNTFTLEGSVCFVFTNVITPKSFDVSYNTDTPDGCSANVQANTPMTTKATTNPFLHYGQDIQPTCRVAITRGYQRGYFLGFYMQYTSAYHQASHIEDIFTLGRMVLHTYIKSKRKKIS